METPAVRLWSEKRQKYGVMVGGYVADADSTYWRMTGKLEAIKVKVNGDDEKVNTLAGQTCLILKYQ